MMFDSQNVRSPQLIFRDSIARQHRRNDFDRMVCRGSDLDRPKESFLFLLI